MCGCLDKLQVGPRGMADDVKAWDGIRIDPSRLRNSCAMLSSQLQPYAI